MSQRYLIVGAGFYGAVCARELADAGHQVLVVEQRDHLGGNAYTRFDEESRSHQHVYGPHIFHTNHRETWEFVQRFAEFNHFVNRPKVKAGGKLYSFPLNLLTLYEVFGVQTPEEARERLAAERVPFENPANLEEWCLNEIGPRLYETFIRGYTEKQWGRPPKELPAGIIKRLPIRLTFDDNYFRDRYQGIPTEGYTRLFQRMLAGIPVELGVDFLADRDGWLQRYDHVIYSGPLDAFFGYEFGVLAYRSLRFENEHVAVDDFQGNAIVNYPDADVAWTRITEHRHFTFGPATGQTLITREYPDAWEPGKTEFYPLNTTEAQERFRRYQNLAREARLPVTFGGRLGDFRYYDMHQVIAAARQKVATLLTSSTASPCPAPTPVPASL